MQAAPPTQTSSALRRGLTASGRLSLFVWLEIAFAVALVIMVWTAYWTFSSAPPGGQPLPSVQVTLVLIGALVPALGLLILAGRRLALRRAAGSTARLHVRLVFLFSLIAAVPTLLFAAFAAVLFKFGVDFFFSDASRGLMEDANQLAQGYYQNNQLDVGQETVAMAGDMRSYLEQGQHPGRGLRDLVRLPGAKPGNQRIGDTAGDGGRLHPHRGAAEPARRQPADRFREQPSCGDQGRAAGVCRGNPVPDRGRGPDRRAERDLPLHLAQFGCGKLRLLEKGGVHRVGLQPPDEPCAGLAAPFRRGSVPSQPGAGGLRRLGSPCALRIAQVQPLTELVAAGAAGWSW